MDENLNNLTHIFDVAKKFESNQRKNLIISTVPSVICIGGVFLLHFGIYSSIVLYYGGLLTGIANTSIAKSQVSSCPKKI